MRNKKRIAAIALCAALATSIVPFAAACNDSSSDSAYFVNYDLNYADVDARKMTVQSGQKAREWRAYREGYSLIGWYTDEACTVPYDFSKGVSGDITLYAGWKPEKGFVEVNFKFSCPGKTNKTLLLKSGDKVMSKAIPDTSRIGYNFTGWYKDENCTEKWDLDNDLISDAMTLYAGYEIDRGWVERDENDNVVYENENVTVWCANTSIINYEVFQQIVGDFNKEYEGKIKINVTDIFTGQSTLLLRNQLTSSIVNDPDTQYSTADMFSVAGVEFDNSEFYEDSIQETFAKGIMKALPLAARVPYIIYNKALIKKYNEDKLPTNYTELTDLLKKAYAGEISINADFAPFIQSEYYFKENTNTLPFVQNGVDFCKLGNGKMINDWKVPEVKTSVIDVLNKSYNLFGVRGECRGRTISGQNADKIINDVKSGNSLFGIIGLSGGMKNDSSEYGNYDSKVLAEAENVGVMSVSGLFSDNDDDISKRIPVVTSGLSFCKLADGVTNKQLCASAVFAKYLVENSYKFAEAGLAPLNKKAYAEFNKTDYEENTRGALIKKVVEKPEYLYSMPGIKSLKAIRTQAVAMDNLLPFFKEEEPNIDDRFTQLLSSVMAKIS